MSPSETLTVQFGRRVKQVAKGLSILKDLRVYWEEGESATRHKGKHMTQVAKMAWKPGILALGFLFHPPLILLATV